MSRERLNIKNIDVDFRKKEIWCKKKKCHIKCCWNALDLVPNLMFAEQNSKIAKCAKNDTLIMLQVVADL